MEKQKKISDDQRKIIITFGTILAVYFGFKYILPLFVPFLLAYFVAWLIRPIASVLHRRFKIPIIIGGGVALLLFLGILLLGIFWIGKLLIEQIIMFLKNIPVFTEYISGQVDGICRGCDKMFNIVSGTAKEVVEHGMQSLIDFVQVDLLPKMTSCTIQFAMSTVEVFAGLVIMIVSVLLIIKDMEEYKIGLRKSKFYPKMHQITSKLSEAGVAYLKTQMIIMSIIATICVIALWILKNPYALLIGIGIAIFDAFPVLGSGLILLPWAIVMMIQKNFFGMAVLIILYILCQFTRDFLEPKLLGNRIGIKPIFSLMSMYIGVKLFGILGFLLGPLGLIIIITVIKTFGTNKSIIS